MDMMRCACGYLLNPSDPLQDWCEKPHCQLTEKIKFDDMPVVVPAGEKTPRVWIIESAAGVVITHYPIVAAKYELSPLHVVTPYRSKLP